MREYETVYVLDPALTDADVSHSQDKVAELIGRHGGSIIRSQNLGKKTLAYRIKKQSKGYYVAIDYCGDNTTVSDIERMFKLDERVLRYLTTKLSEEIDIEARKQELVEEAERLAAAIAQKAAAHPRVEEVGESMEVKHA
ncbi:MAG: 30S ribosomal protein S6 [Deltaproteobacteria bacterium RIFCSPLOWO2_02_FULL_47_10]|nr:MAG: 30S ribosomal protein S6 [Deltaproteobacteria bacterium RIFCSPLOWO2_02_FULL_47_10]